MSSKKTRILAAWVFLQASFLQASAKAALQAGDLKRIRMPPGFRISILSDRVPGARQMALGDRGTLFVGTMNRSVYALPGVGRTPESEHKVLEIANNLRMPNGVAFRDGALYVAEISRILRFDKIEESLGETAKNGLKAPAFTVVDASYPKDTHHGWKYIGFGPDRMLYVPVGAPCNVCESSDPRYASVTRLEPGGGAPKVYATGVRNTVGFDWNPETGSLWFTDNGRDYLGDELPPDELNRATKAGDFFGFPNCYGDRKTDPEHGAGKDCAKSAPPELGLPAHVAALGMKFYRGKMFPKEYRNQIFVAEHGSWNRSEPIGYQVIVVRQKDDHATKWDSFAQGWLQGGKAWGRPVDILNLPDGSLLVSDDQNGAIYRISYSG